MSDDYNENSMDSVISKLDAKFDAFVQSTQEWRELQTKQIDEWRRTHTEQIASLQQSVNSHEKFKYWVLGMAAATGAVGSKLVAYLTGGPSKP